MVKRKRKTNEISRTQFLAIEGPLLLLLSCIALLTFYFIYGYDTNHIKHSIIKQQSNLFQSALSDLKQENDALSSQITMYQNIDQETINVQNEYFNNLKQLEQDIQSGNSNRKIAYLTFDDGPYYRTYQVFDILDRYGIKATFFTTNINGEYCYDDKSQNCWIRYREYVERGHTIANHTYTHAIFRGLYSSTDSFMEAIVNQENLIMEQTGGYQTRIVRFPGGSGTARDLKDPIIERLRERGYGWVDWTANDGDGGNLTSYDAAWNNFTSSINDNIEVILYHDYNGITVDLLPQMIEYLQNNGYECYPLFYDSIMVNK